LTRNRKAIFHVYSLVNTYDTSAAEGLHTESSRYHGLRARVAASCWQHAKSRSTLRALLTRKQTKVR